MTFHGWIYSKIDVGDIMFGFALKHHSLSLGEGEGGEGFVTIISDVDAV